MKNKIKIWKRTIEISIFDKAGILLGITKIDRADYEKIRKHNWYWGKRSGGERGYVRSGINHIGLHQLLMGKKKGLEIDHINGDKLDNRRQNLRHITHSENIINSKIQSNNKSGYKGVYWSNYANKWIANIKKDGIQRCLGWFINKGDAVKARKKAEKLYFRSL